MIRCEEIAWSVCESTDYLSPHDLLDDKKDTLLLAASQSYESGGTANLDNQIDNLF